MDEQKARSLVEDEGFEVLELIEYNGGIYVFNCKDGDDEIEVIVENGEIMIAPT